MKIILPVAGKGTRLRPHTHTKPKSLVHVAGRAVLGHILDNFEGIDVDELIFIVDEGNGVAIKEYVGKHYSQYKSTFVEQKERLGPGHAVAMARDHIKEGDDMLIVFNDTMFITDLKQIKQSYSDADGLIYAKKTKDPERFGIIVLDEKGEIKSLVEKPKEFIGDLAIVGMYYLKDAKKFMDVIQHTIDQKMTERGEYYLTKPLQMYIDQGAHMKAPEIDEWLDCGKPETLLETNKYLLQHGNQQVIEGDNVVVIPPVFIEKGAEIRNSVIGPNVSIARGSNVEDCVIRNSILNENTSISASVLNKSIVAANAKVKGGFRVLNVGEDSQVEIQ